MSEQAALTMRLSEWIATTSDHDIPGTVLHQTKRVILDFVACAIVGATSNTARIVQQLLAETDSDTSSGVIGTPLRMSPAGAALANGTAVHAFDVDDGYTPGSFHPGGPVLSAVVAAAEAQGASAADILRAATLGYELSCRLAGAGHPATRRRGFHNTPVAGVFGAAAGVAAILGLGADDTASALGLAGSHAGGLFEFLGQGSEVKRLHAGKAGRDGLLSAQLAARGLTGPRTVLEGPNGYFQAFAGGDYDSGHLMDGLGEDWRMLRSYVKPYPCCRHLHGPIDAVRQLQEEAPIDLDGLEAVTVDTYDLASGHDLRTVDDLLDAQMSLPFAVAVSIVHGEPGLQAFSQAVRSDPVVRRVMERVEVRSSSDCEREYPAKRPARVTVRSAGGERSVYVPQPYGEPDNPISDTDLDAKLARLAAPIIGEERCKEIAAEVWAFDDPPRLFGLLAGPAERPLFA